MAKEIFAGKCHLCGERYKKSGMIRHLKACLGKHDEPVSGKKSQKVYWITAAGKWYHEYWLHLEIPAAQHLLDLDQFLRDIWLECCGHLSAFTIQGIEYQLNTGMVDAMWIDFFGPSLPTKSMKTKLYEIFQPGLAFKHRYDFGTTTELQLKVIAEKSRASPSDEIRVLARNNPPEIPCTKCGQPATQVCSQCIYEGPQAWHCDRCSRKHKCGEEMFLPVVNSPRVGECGYTGPWED